MAYLGRDEWDYTPRRPSPHRANRSSFYLDPDAGYGANLYRTRSQGARPNPVINVYNDVYQDAINRVSPPVAPPGAYPAAFPPPPPQQPQVVPVPYAVDGDRGRRVYSELADELHELRLERSRDRSRGRSRGRSDASPPDYYRQELERLEREKAWRYEQERIKAEAEVKHLKNEARRKQHEDDEEADRKRIIAEYDKRKRDEQEAEKRMREKFEAEAAAAKKKEKELYDQFIAKQKEEKEKKEKEDKAAKERLETEMRKRLAERGFAGSQIENIVNEKRQQQTTTTTSLTVFNGGHQPVYAKVHKSYLSVDTLRYYDIPFKYDDLDSDYIIILREMDKHETNILFEHTKALRAGRLLIEAPKKDKEFAFFRRRERSKSRNRSGEWKQFGIIEYKK